LHNNSLPGIEQGCTWPAERDLSVEKFNQKLIYGISVAAFGYKGISQFIESKDEYSYLVMRESDLRSEHDVSPRLSFLLLV
jgi:hypothetical protein